MPRRPFLVKTSSSSEPCITSTSAKEEAPQPERSEVSDQTRRRQLAGSRVILGIQLLDRINPRVAIAVVSCSLFAGLLFRVSHVVQDQPLALTPQLVTMTSPAELPRQPGPTRQVVEAAPSATVVAARMIDAPAAISASCREQAWPYVTGDCLTRGDDHIQTESVATETNPVTEVADHIVPAALIDVANAQAKMSPEDSLTVVLDKPHRSRSASKQRHRQVHVERKRGAPRLAASGGVAFGAPAFTPLEANNMP